MKMEKKDPKKEAINTIMKFARSGMVKKPKKKDEEEEEEDDDEDYKRVIKPEIVS